MLGELREVPISLCIVDQNFNTRSQGVGDVSELAESIKAIGIEQPLLGKDRENTKGEIEIYAGYRRLAAAAIAGLEAVPVMVTKRRAMTRKDMLKANITENLNRRDLNPVDEARAFYRLQEEHGVSIDEMCDTMGLKTSFILDRLDLLKLTPVVLNALQFDEITIQAAKEIDRLPLDKQEKFVEIAKSFRGTKLRALVEKELDKIQQKLDGIDRKERTQDAADIVEHVRTIRKASSVVCTGLGYDEDQTKAVKHVNFKALGSDDLRVVAKLIDDCADRVEDEVLVNDKVYEELIETSNTKELATTDRVKSLWVQMAYDEAKRIAVEVNPDKPRITLAIMRKVLKDLYQ